MAPRRRDYDRDVRAFLRTNINSRHPTWGYTIYRTVYTAESEEAWPSIVTKINEYIRHDIFREIESHKKYYEITHGPLDPSPNEQVWELHKPTIVSDPALYDGATFEDIRRHWRADVEGRGFAVNDSFTGNNVCLVVDEEVFEMVRDAPSPAELGRTGKPWIRAVDGAWEADDADEGYLGVWRVNLDSLWFFWWDCYGPEGMAEKCPRGSDDPPPYPAYQ
ncbi:hypothetical protein ACEPPN_015411 [Leptodophora sp. 'Broadleaf-Isolate-01']